MEDNHIKLVDLKTNQTTVVVSLSDLTDVSDSNIIFNIKYKRYAQEHGRPLGLAKWHPSPDMQYLLIKTDYRKVFFFSVHTYNNY